MKAARNEKSQLLDKAVRGERLASRTRSQGYTEDAKCGRCKSGGDLAASVERRASSRSWLAGGPAASLSSSQRKLLRNDPTSPGSRGVERVAITKQGRGTNCSNVRLKHGPLSQRGQDFPDSSSLLPNPLRGRTVSIEPVTAAGPCSTKPSSYGEKQEGDRL